MRKLITALATPFAAGKIDKLSFYSPRLTEPCGEDKLKNYDKKQSNFTIATAPASSFPPTPPKETGVVCTYFCL